jgi:hypothetical protein
VPLETTTTFAYRRADEDKSDNEVREAFAAAYEVLHAQVSDEEMKAGLAD